MRWLKALLATVFAFAAVARGQPSINSPADDARAIIILILANEARIHSDPEFFGPGCVHMETDSTAFDETRDRLAQIAREIQQSTGRQRDQLRQIRDRSMLRQEYEWGRPSAALGAWPRDGDFDAEMAEVLNEAAHRIVHGPTQPRLVDQIEMVWLRVPLRPCPRARSLPSLKVSSPAFHGDIAFVETGFVCGGLCGFGLLYALKRRETGWEIVSVANTWVS